MSQPLLKKQVAALAGVCPRTMARNREKFRWLDRCRTAGTGRRPTYNATRVQEELKKRRIL